MVGVLMCNQNCADILLLDVRLVQAAFQLSQSEAIVHQNSCGVVLHEDGIPIAAAAKGDYPHNTPHFRLRAHMLKYSAKPARPRYLPDS